MALRNKNLTTCFRLRNIEKGNALPAILGFQDLALKFVTERHHSRKVIAMTKKPHFDPSAMTDAMKEQAQQIWLAGLGAFSKAQQDGTKAFEKLVHDGLGLQRKAQTAAEEKLTEATQKVAQAAHQFNERAAGQWDKLENIFEDRVAKALHRMGMPSAKDLQALQARIDALEAQLKKGRAEPQTTPRKTAAKPAAKKVRVKKSAS